MPLNAQRMAELRRRAMKGGAMSQRPPFNPPLGLWIAGIHYTALLIADSLKIRSTAYSQTGVFSFKLDGTIGGPLAAVAVEQEVTLNKGGVLYAGRVRMITPEDQRPGVWSLDVECQDFTTLLDESICAYSNAHTNPVRTDVESDAQRISWLLQSYDRYGITASHVQTLTTSMPAQDFSGLTLTAAIKAVLAFGNGALYVDFSKDLHTFTSEANPAPFGLSDAPDDVVTFAFSDFSYPRDSIDLVNAVYPIGGRGLYSVTETMTATGNIGAAPAVMVSFKPASVGTPIQQVGREGDFLTGTNTAVNPLFKQGTLAGDFLLAWVESDSALPATNAAGWEMAGYIGPGFTGLVSSVWCKANCAAGETAPQFTAVGGLGPMTAQLAEFSGVALSQPVDQVTTLDMVTLPGLPGAGAVHAITAAAVDVVAGELVVFGVHTGQWAASIATFTESFNNAGITVHLGDDASLNQDHHASHAYSILPSAVARWYTDEASIATYGRREASITDTSVTTQAGLDLLGAAYLAAHKDPLRHCTLKCRQVGLAAGMTINVTNALYGLVAQPFRIQGLTTSYPDGVAPEFEVQFADTTVTLASQMVALQDQIAGGGTATSSDVQKLAAVVAANTLGTLGYAEVTANQGPLSAITDLDGLAVTVTVGTGRRIRVSALVDLFGTVANDQSEVNINEGGTVLQGVILRHAATGHLSHAPAVILTPTAGSHTYKLTGQRLSGTGTFTMSASGGQPAFIQVEDVGT